MTLKEIVEGGKNDTIGFQTVISAHGAERVLAEIRAEIQRLLRWTREKPTAPGWYWMQSKTQSATIVRVDTSVDDNLCVDGLEDFDCEAWQDDLGTMAGGEWAGPIPEPGERS